ncbi:transporter [Fibrobacter succinogenes]|uniref:transporter n=1 Tax=Fibrobacter succinogenes TaxID=833 RepID=UPI0015673D45|nr:transporter [Fibrobacter succinogenes]
MLKRFILIMALAVSASFATWDYFPIRPALGGSAEVGLYYDWDHAWSQAGLSAGARISIIDVLELSVVGFGYQFWGEQDCRDCFNGGNGMRDVTLGGRFQITPMVSAFLDVHLPIGTDEVKHEGLTPPGNNELSLYLGAQFSMDIKEAPGLSFGTEAGFDWGFKHYNPRNGRHDYERGLELHLAGEIDYTIPKTQVTPYLGLQFKLRLTENTWDEGDNERGDDTDFDDSQFNFWLGAQFDINPAIYIKAHLKFRTGDMDGEATGIYMAGGFNF